MIMLLNRTEVKCCRFVINKGLATLRGKHYLLISSHMQHACDVMALGYEKLCSL